MIRTVILLALLAPMTHAQQTLDTLGGKNRILLVFAPSDQDPRYTQQLTLLAPHSTEMKQRDLLLLPALLRSGPPVTTGTLRLPPSPGLPDHEAMRARRRFHIASNDFASILIGKDGGEKFRSHQPVSIEHLNQLIDAMPMRQDEMRATHSPRP